MNKTFDNEKFFELEELRDKAGIDPKAAAKFFNLGEKRGHETFRLWERGRISPGKKRISQWRKYLWSFLNLREEPKKFRRIWETIAVAEWKFPSLNALHFETFASSNRSEVTGAIPFQAPNKSPLFVGRKQILLDIELSLLESPPNKVIIIVGMPGIGKTVMTTELAHRLRTRFRNGVLWGDFKEADGAAILRRFIESYQPDFEHPKPGLETEDPNEYLRLLADNFGKIMTKKQTLVILDNVTREVEVEPFMSGFRDSAMIVITPNRYLSAPLQTTRVQLPHLDPDKNESLNLAIQILDKVRRENRKNAEFILRESARQYHTDELIEIVAFLEHHPLAVTIAASRLAYEPGWTTKLFLSQLKQTHKRLDMLTHEERSVRIAFETSYMRLTSETRSVFNLLGLFDGNPFSIEAVAHIASIPSTKVHKELIALHRLSLIELVIHESVDTTRYRLHRLVSDYAYEHLQEIESIKEFEQRFVAYFLDLLFDNKEHNLINQEDANIQRAWSFAEKHDMHSAVVDLTIAYFSYLERRGEFGKARSLLQSALNLVAPEENKWQLGSLQRQMGSALIRLGDYAEASKFLEQAYSLAKQLGDTELILDCLQSLGLVRYHQAKYEEAETFYQEGLDFARDSENLRRMVSFKVNLSNLYGQQAKLSLMQKELETALPVARNHDDKEPVVVILQNLSVINVYKGDLIKGNEQISEAIELAENAGFWGRLPDLLIIAGGIPEREGNFSKAKEKVIEALSKSKAREHAKSIMFALENLGNLELLFGDLAAADRYIQQGLTMAHNTGNTERIVALQALKGAFLIKQGEYSDAEKLLTDTLKLAQEHRLGIHKPKIFNYLGKLSLSKSDLSSAHASYSSSKEIAEKNEFGVKVDLAEALFGLAKTEKIKGNLKAADDFAKQSRDVFEEMGHYRAAKVEAWRQELNSES